MMSTTFWLKCAGCRKTVCSGDYDDPDQYEVKIEQFKRGGWFRREFGPNASPWFCSQECGYHSLAAKKAEEWWNKYNQEKEYEEYCEKTLIHPRYYGILGFLLVVAFFFIIAMSGSC